MKKLISFCLAIVAIAFTSNLFAQTLEVEQGAVKTYTTSAAGGSDVSNGYVWSLTGGSSTFANSGIATQSVTWDVVSAGNILRVYGVSGNSCNGSNQDVTVNVVAALSRSLTADASPNLCPLTDNGGDYASSALVLTGAVPAGNWTINYNVNGGAVQTSGALAGLTPTATNLAQFANASNTVNGSHTINIVSYTVDGTTYTPASPITVAVTVYPTPAVNTITSN